MSAPSPTCALGLAPATLSAWRDAMLDATEAARVAAHIAGCAGCRARLADYETIANQVRAERVPAPDARLWRDLRGRVLVTPRRGSRTLGRGWVGTVAAAVAVVVIVAGFARLFGLGSSQRNTSLVWQSVSLPAGVGFYYNHGLGLTDADGDTAYTCAAAFGPAEQPPTPGNVATEVFVTHDRGQTWNRVTDLPDQLKAHGCYVIADATDPLTAIATSSEATDAGSLGSAQTESFLTRDGGATWQPLTDAQDYAIRDFATASNAAFAVRGGQGQTSWQLVESNDGMQTWLPIDQAITAAGQYVLAFWAVPSTTGVSLIAEAVAPNSAHDDLWATDSSGKRWSRVSPPTLSATVDVSYVVQTSSTARDAWQACAVTYAGAEKVTLAPLVCTSDGGQTWSQRQTPQLPGGDALIPPGGAALVSIVGLARDGAVLGTVTSSQSSSLYRLPLGASAWQSLGSLPERLGVPTYAPAPSDGVLWLQPTFTNQGDALDPHGAVYTAAYGRTPRVAPAWTPPPTPTPVPATTVPGPTLVWSPVLRPPRPGAGQSLGPLSDELVVAPGDGTTAYTCIAGDDSHGGLLPQVWRTRDTGASWQRVADVPSRAQADECRILVDPSDALHVLAVLSFRPRGDGGGGPDISTVQNFTSSDGGATWTALPTRPQASWISQIASYQGIIYAIRSVLGQHGVATDLYASADGMQTWQSLSAALAGQTDFVQGFWLDQATGTLLAQTAQAEVSQTLWHSDDGGHHWTRLTNAPFAADATFVAQMRGSGQAWRVCGGWYDASMPQAPERFACSGDGGLHWADQPTLATDDHGTPLSDAAPARLAVADDGALLVLGSTDQIGPVQLYRLVPGSTQWQECGQSSSPAVAGLSPISYSSSPGQGMFWGGVDGRLFVARYS
jgi:hypothetical protein